MSSGLTSVELFAGGGGMALGARLAGFEHLALVEWYRSAAAILHHNGVNNPDWWDAKSVFEQDVRVWLKQTDLSSGDIDLVAGGPPCQPFSLAGVHAGRNDKRNMFPAAVDAVRKFLPRFVLFENVPGLTRPSFAPYFAYIKDQLERPDVSPKDGELWFEHHARIRKSGSTPHRYTVHEHRLEAADFGLPQGRRRVILIAVRADEPGADTWICPAPTHARDSLLYDQWVSGEYWTEHDLTMPEPPDGLDQRICDLKENGRPPEARWRTIRDCINGLPEPIDGAEAKGISNHEGIGGARTYRKHSGSAFDWPAKTIKAGVHGVSGGEAMIRFDDGTLRYFTVRESARLQGFPDCYDFPVNRSRSMEAIGNAVAVPIAELLTRRIVAHFGVETSQSC